MKREKGRRRRGGQQQSNVSYREELVPYV